MSNPYTVLGVSQNASEEEIKNAYRELARKYHADNFDDPVMKELAEKKMEEINQAYDQIISNVKKNTTNGGNSWNSPEFSEIASHIQSGEFEKAQLLLDQVPINKRTARWYFLSGKVMYNRGWYDNAFTNFATAYRMEPQNQEYRAALEQMNRMQNGGGYRSRTYPNSGTTCSTCDICQAMICADCCCECMGGDLISCC